MASLPQGRRFDWSNLGLRAASAAVLIPAVLTAVSRPPIFLVLIAVAVAVVSIEWAQMTTPKSAQRMAVVTTVAVLIPLFLAYRHNFITASVFGVVGVAAAALAARHSEHPVGAALGVGYIAAPCLALAWMGANDHQFWWTVLLFAVTWSADIFAYVVGNLLKGPKLWPRFSPNKTWSGFFGGLLAAIAAAVLVGCLIGPCFEGKFRLASAFAAKNEFRLTPGFAAVVGLVGGLATMAGDLWESMLKRHYGVKDTGDLIPGHGGLLDRVDGLMFAILAVAGARFVHQLGWAY